MSSRADMLRLLIEDAQQSKRIWEEALLAQDDLDVIKKIQSEIDLDDRRLERYRKVLSEIESHAEGK